MCDSRAECGGKVGSRSRHAIPLSHHSLNDHKDQRIRMRPTFRLEGHSNGAEGILIILT